MRFELILLVGFVSFGTSAPTGTPTSSTATEEQSLCPHSYSRWLPITPQHSQLRSYSDRLHVSRLSQRDVTDLYVFFLESTQSVQFLLTLISDRVCEIIPRPHHHCFLTERDPATIFTEDSMYLERLAADQRMLSEFIPALDNLLIYENTHHGCDQENMVQNILNVQTRVELALEALSNFTRVPLPEQERPSEEEPTAESEDSTEAATNIQWDISVSVSSPSRDNRDTHTLDNNIPPVSTASPPAAVPTDPSDNELINQGGNDPNRSARSSGRARRSVNQETSSNVSPIQQDSPPHCSYPQNDEDQFVYMYELWITISYISSDLKAIRANLSSN